MVNRQCREYTPYTFKFFFCSQVRRDLVLLHLDVMLYLTHDPFYIQYVWIHIECCVRMHIRHITWKCSVLPPKTPPTPPYTHSCTLTTCFVVSDCVLSPLIHSLSTTLSNTYTLGDTQYTLVDIISPSQYHIFSIHPG